jgi:hypothetical protein
LQLKLEAKLGEFPGGKLERLIRVKRAEAIAELEAILGERQRLKKCG